MFLDLASLGQNGSTFASGTESITSGNYIGFLCVDDTEIGAFKGQLKDVGETPLTDLTGVVFPAGIYVPVPFLTLTLVSGGIIAIKASNHS